MISKTPHSPAASANQVRSCWLIRSRRLDAGESASIAIAAKRSLAFASDDEDALILWQAMTGSPGLRTLDLLQRAAASGLVGQGEVKVVYLTLQTDDLHNLGGPAGNNGHPQTARPPASHP